MNMGLNRGLLVCCVGLLAQTTFAADAKKLKEDVKRGEFLVGIGGCNDCHTPWAFDKQLGAPAPDMTRMLSGHPAGAPDPGSKLVLPDQAVIGPTFTSFALPFGVVYAVNLTPDPDSGLGNWTEAMFVSTLRTGRHLGAPAARPVLPPMPIRNLQGLTDGDLKAMFAYLRTVPAVKNVVPPPKVPAEVINQMTLGANKMDAAKATNKK